jgi:hypothetical protein
MPADSRITVVARPVDRFLTGLKVALIPVVAVMASMYSLLLLNRSVKPHDLLVGIIGPAIAAAYILALQHHKVSGPIDRWLARLRRWVATACNHDDWVDHDDSRLACLLTAEIFRAPMFDHDQQRKVVEELMQACGAEHSADYWFIEGEPGSGKTRAALQVVQNLARDRRLFELGGRCHIYDFADSTEVQDELLRRLGGPGHDGAVVLVDNFQLVRTKALQKLTSRLVGPRSHSERLLVFLARPGEAWSLGSGSDVRLMSVAKAKSRYLKLSGPSSETVVDRVFDVDGYAAQLVRKLQQDYVASATQLHLAQVIARNGALPSEVRDMVLLLSECEDASPSPWLVEQLAVMSAIAVHRGSFSRRDLHRALRAARRVRGGGLLDAIRMRWAFRRLYRIGLVPKLHLDGTRYLFHETIAELCIDRLSSRPAFHEPFVAVGRMRLQRVRAERQALDTWLVGAEIEDQDTVERRFDEALSQGSYGRMARCLERADKRYVLNAPTRLQLAILLDRTGDFKASREQYTDDLADALVGSNELAAVLVTSRLEASHDEVSVRALQALRTSTDRLTALTGEYWELHIAAHTGSFDAPRLLDLVSEALALVDGRESQWTTHSLARMHFDSLRHHYLAGGQPTDAIDSPRRDALNDYLRTRLPTYEAFHALYTRAHLVGHVLLPQLAIYKQSLSVADASLAKIDRADAATPGALAHIALGLYRDARDEFWQYGDREARYLQAEVLNATMIQDEVDLDSLVVDLHSYKRFIEDAGFESLASYPHLYFFRWNVLKYYDVLLRGNGDPSASDQLLPNARREVERVAELDMAAGNDYGVLRAELLGLLLAAVREPLDPGEVRSLEALMAKRGYGSEQRLLRHLAERGSLTPAELREIVRFVPFVQQ